MSDERKLLDAIRAAAPRDHRPRLEYASWLEAKDPADPRVERIRLELEIRGKRLAGEPDLEERIRLIRAQERLRELSELVGEQACRDVPVVADPCPSCGEQLEWDPCHPYQSDYGLDYPMRCPRCGWTSR